MAKKTLQVVGFRMTPELKGQLTALAESDQRTFANYVVKLLTDHVAQQKKPKPRPNGAVVAHEKGATA